MDPQTIFSDPPGFKTQNHSEQKVGPRVGGPLYTRSGRKSVFYGFVGGILVCLVRFTVFWIAPNSFRWFFGHPETKITKNNPFWSGIGRAGDPGEHFFCSAPNLPLVGTRRVGGNPMTAPL